MKGCNDKSLKHLKDDPPLVWEELGCDSLHNVLLFDWYQNGQKSELTYVEYVLRCPEEFFFFSW